MTNMTLALGLLFFFGVACAIFFEEYMLALYGLIILGLVVAAHLASSTAGLRGGRT